MNERPADGPLSSNEAFQRVTLCCKAREAATLSGLGPDVAVTVTVAVGVVAAAPGFSGFVPF